MGQVKTLLAMYVPPDPQRMQEAFQASKVSIIPSPGSGTPASSSRTTRSPATR